MIYDSITWGETYSIVIPATDPDGDPIVLDSSYLTAGRVTRKPGGAAFLELETSIDDGKVVASFDTGESPWAPGVYFYDIRVTDSDGFEWWTEMVQLTLIARNTPPSVPEPEPEP